MWVSCCSMFCFLCRVLLIIVCHDVLFLLPNVLSVLLRFTASDYPFGSWFSLGTQFSSTNKTDHHDITVMLLKVALNTITITLAMNIYKHKER